MGLCRVRLNAEKIPRLSVRPWASIQRTERIRNPFFFFIRVFSGPSLPMPCRPDVCEDLDHSRAVVAVPRRDGGGHHDHRPAHLPPVTNRPNRDVAHSVPRLTRRVAGEGGASPEGAARAAPQPGDKPGAGVVPEHSTKRARLARHRGSHRHARGHRHPSFAARRRTAGGTTRLTDWATGRGHGLRASVAPAAWRAKFHE